MRDHIAHALLWHTDDCAVLYTRLRVLGWPSTVPPAWHCTAGSPELTSWTPFWRLYQVHWGKIRPVETPPVWTVTMRISCRGSESPTTGETTGPLRVAFLEHIWAWLASSRHFRRHPAGRRHLLYTWRLPEHSSCHGFNCKYLRHHEHSRSHISCPAYTSG